MTDIIKLSMLAVADYINQLENQDVYMLMQVHDELVFEVKEDTLDTHVPNIIHIMESAVSLSVPLIVEADVGDNWDEAH